MQTFRNGYSFLIERWENWDQQKLDKSNQESFDSNDCGSIALLRGIMMILHCELWCNAIYIRPRLDVTDK